MKATIRRPDGTTIEAEGTPEEIERLTTPLPVRDPLPWVPPIGPVWIAPPQPSDPPYYDPWAPCGPTVTGDRVIVTCSSTVGAPDVCGCPVRWNTSTASGGGWVEHVAGCAYAGASC